jgi:hypothetical protein
MLNTIHKKGISLCSVLLLLSISFFSVQSYAPAFQRNTTNPYDDLTKIQLKGECYEFFETHHIGQPNHIGPLWFSSPSSVLTFRFRKDFVLIMGNVVQDTEPAMDVFVFRFQGFCLTPTIINILVNIWISYQLVTVRGVTIFLKFSIILF